MYVQKKINWNSKILNPPARAVAIIFIPENVCGFYDAWFFLYLLLLYLKFSFLVISCIWNSWTGVVYDGEEMEGKERRRKPINRWIFANQFAASASIATLAFHPLDTVKVLNNSS